MLYHIIADTFLSIYYNFDSNDFFREVHTTMKGVCIIKIISLDEMVEITSEMFDTYVEPVALSLMCGEVPSTTFVIHRTGTKENDWLAHIRFKNTLTISVFRCDVYLDDIMTLCRRCKMYLVTKEVFRVAVTFAMLHPLYQTQYMNFTTDVNTDYESMMSGAGKASYQFMKKHFEFHDPFERTVLETLRYHSMIFINNFSHAPKNVRIGDIIEELNYEYSYQMNAYYPLAYKTAKYSKAQTNLVDLDGFIKLEPKSKGVVRYVGKETAESKHEGENNLKESSSS